MSEPCKFGLLGNVHEQISHIWELNSIAYALEAFCFVRRVSGIPSTLAPGAELKSEGKAIRQDMARRV